MSDFKYYVETLNSEAHRAVVVAKNGKCVFPGEWQSRAWKARRSLQKMIYDIVRNGGAVIYTHPHRIVASARG